MQRYMDAFTAGMQEHALIAGRDFDIVLRSAESDPKRIPGLLVELIALNPAVIMTARHHDYCGGKKSDRDSSDNRRGNFRSGGFWLSGEPRAPRGGNVTGLLSSDRQANSAEAA